MGFFIILMVTFSADFVFAKGGITPTRADLTLEYNGEIKEKCQGKVKYDFADYYPNDQVPRDGLTGLYVSKSFLQEACEVDLENFSKFVQLIIPKSIAGDSVSYRLKEKILYIENGIKFINRDWDQDMKNLRTYLRQQTHLPLLTMEESKQTQDQKKQDELNQKREAKEKAQESKTVKLKQSADELSQKLQKASEKYQSRVQAIWAAPGNDATTMQKKQKESADALAEFNQAQAEFQNNLDQLNKAHL